MKKNNDSRFAIVFIVILSLIGGCVAFAFRLSTYGNELEIKDYFNFAGSFGGAILGAFISLLILKVTLEKQKEQFDAERKRTYKIEMINEEIKYHKENMKLCLEIKTVFNDCIDNIRLIQGVCDGLILTNIIESFIKEFTNLYLKINNNELLINANNSKFNILEDIRKDIVKYYIKYATRNTKEKSEYIEFIKLLKKKKKCIDLYNSYIVNEIKNLNNIKTDI